MIYTVRRFSEAQKEFGWIKDRLQKTIEREESKIKDYDKKLSNLDKLIDSDLERKMIKDNENVSVVFPREINTPVRFKYPDKARSRRIKEALKDPSNDFTEDDTKLLMLVMNRDDQKISEVYWNSNDGLEKLAHEFGHVRNYRGNLLDQFIHKGARFGNNLRKKSGVTNAVLDILGSKFINWEESNASKKGYEMLKTYGLSKEDLEAAKKIMDYALEKYRSQSKISWRKKLLDSKISKWL